jgi:hypothetical protein
MILSLEAVEEPTQREEVTTPVVFTLPVIDTLIAEWNASHPVGTGSKVPEPGRNGAHPEPPEPGRNGVHPKIPEPARIDIPTKFLIRTSYPPFPVPVPNSLPISSPTKVAKGRKRTKRGAAKLALLSMLEYLIKNFEWGLTDRQIARRAGVNPGTLCRHLKKHSGDSHVKERYTKYRNRERGAW